MSDEYFFDDENEELTAYHEAGHAVMAVALGGILERVTLEPPNDDGPTRYGDTIVKWHEADPTTSVVRQLKVILAGPIAEKIYSDSDIPLDAFEPWQMDWRQAASLIQQCQIPAQEAAKLLATIESELHEFFSSDQHWAAISATADLLLAHQTVYHREVFDTVMFWLVKKNVV